MLTRFRVDHIYTVQDGDILGIHAILRHLRAPTTHSPGSQAPPQLRPKIDPINSNSGMSSKPLSSAELFDSVGKPYEDAFRDVPGQQGSLQWLLTHLPPNAKVLDVGSGTGKPACDTLANAGHEVTGIDVSPVMVGTAQKQILNAKFVLADTKTWEPEAGDATFDAVVIYFSIISDFSQEEIKRFFGKVARWLKKGGIFVFGTVLVEGNLINGKWMGRDVVVSGLSEEDNLEAIKKAGFVVEKHETETFVPKGEEAGLCNKEDVWDEPMLFVYARKT